MINGFTAIVPNGHVLVVVPCHSLGSRYDSICSPIEIVLPAEETVNPLTPVNVDTLGVERTMLLFDTPTLRAPTASNEREPAPATPEETDEVVLPIAKRLCAPAATVAPDNMIVFDE